MEKIYTHNVAAQIMDQFENLLEEHDITVPSPEDDERGEDNNARLYGTVYGDLMEDVERLLLEATYDTAPPTNILGHKVAEAMYAEFELILRSENVASKKELEAGTRISTTSKTLTIVDIALDVVEVLKKARMGAEIISFVFGDESDDYCQPGCSYDPEMVKDQLSYLRRDGYLCAADMLETLYNQVNLQTEYQFMKQYAAEMDAGDELLRFRLHAMWITYVIHANLYVATSQYDMKLMELWDGMQNKEEAGWQCYADFDNFMCVGLL